MSSLDPRLADEAVAALVAASEAGRRHAWSRRCTPSIWRSNGFLASSACKNGEIAFDRPTAAVTTAMLHELYGNEGRVLPKQGIEVPGDGRGVPAMSWS